MCFNNYNKCPKQASDPTLNRNKKTILGTINHKFDPLGNLTNSTRISMRKIRSNQAFDKNLLLIKLDL